MKSLLIRFEEAILRWVVVFVMQNRTHTALFQ
jgi:hypothetical protein